MGATIRDVAKASGVSVATVSYVLNNGPRSVRDSTRAQVLEAVERLGYHPNALARGLAGHRVNTIGVLFGRVEPEIVTNPYVSAVLQGVFSQSAELGFNVTLFTQRWKSAELSALSLKDGRCDGLLLVAPTRDTDVIPGLAALGMPVVVVSAAVDPSYRMPFVDVDNFQGAKLAVEHLLALGHRRIAHLGGDYSQPSADERRNGYLAAMGEAGLDAGPELVTECGYGKGDAVGPTRRLLMHPQPPTAVFAANDTLALDALRVARELGIRVPDQLSLVGFDDIQAAPLVTPPLTTVRQPMADIGAWATRLLEQLIEGKPVAQQAHRATPEVVVRGSSAPINGQPMARLDHLAA